MATKSVMDKCRELCKFYKVKARFVKRVPGFKGRAIGSARPTERRIWVKKTVSNRKFVSVVFHEIQHCLNYRNKKYYAFHSSFDRKVIRKWAFKAELYTDEQAEKLAFKHKFYYYIRTYYDNEETRKLMKEVY